MGRSQIVPAALFVAVLAAVGPARIEADEAAERSQRAMRFHLLAQQRAGLLVPLYHYPADIHRNAVFNRLIALKLRFETVPVWVIVNPASGPGTVADPNYIKAIDRLQGAGCVVLGYVTTGYAKRAKEQVRADLRSWQRLYPKVQGVFFDEMNRDDNDAMVEHQLRLTKDARALGYWPIVANPGTDTPGRYFEADAADVIVVHEADSWPTEAKMKGDYFGGYADHPPFTRAVLVHSHAALDLKSLSMTRRHARWIYVTDDVYKPNDPAADNPWDSLPTYLEELAAALAR